LVGCIRQEKSKTQNCANFYQTEVGWSLSQSDIDFSGRGIIREWRIDFSRDLTSGDLSSQEVAQ